MKYLVRGFRAARLLLSKTVMWGKLILTSPLQTYNVSCSTHIKCGNKGTIRLGWISTETNVHLVSWGGELIIGKGSGFNRNVIIISRIKIQIGENVSIGPNVCIYDHDHAFGLNGKKDGEYKYAPVVIGNNVWIGSGVVILKGTTIGDNCVIGAGCIVSGEIPQNSIVRFDRAPVIVEHLHG